MKPSIRYRWLSALLLVSASATPYVFAESTALAGGTGGHYFTRQCPPGEYLVGINGRTGWYVDSVTPVCARVTGTTWQAAHPASQFGDVGGWVTPTPTPSGEQALCPTDRLMSAITVKAGAFVHSIRSQCRRIDGSGTPIDGPALVGSEFDLPGTMTLSCPAGQFGKGFSGRSGEFVDAIRLDCVPLSGLYAEDTVIEAGGAGGSPAVSVCPSHQRMIGLISRVSRNLIGQPEWIKGLRPACAAMPTAALPVWNQAMIPTLLNSGRVADIMRLSANVGASDGDTNHLFCPGGQYVEGIEVHFDRFVHSVKLRCRTMTYSQTRSTGLSGRAEGKQEFLACPGDMVASGIVVRAGSAIDALRLRCQRDSNPGTKLLAIVGDSFSAGEGAPDIKVSNLDPQPQNDGPAERTRRSGWVDRTCHRSNLAGTTQAARELVKRTNGQVVFRNFSCSGATIGEGLIGEQQITSENRAPIDKQLDSVGNWARALNKPINTLVISIGGNDAGFGPRIADCAKVEFIENLSLGLAPGACGDETTFRDTIRATLQELPIKFEPLAPEVVRQLNPQNVFLLGYPDPMRHAAGFCNNNPDLGQLPGGFPLFDGLVERILYNAVDGFTEQTSRFVFDEFITPMNRIVGEIARSNGWHPVAGWDVETRGHGFCALGEERFFNLPSDTHRDQGNFNGVFHPNARGYHAQKDLIVASVQPVITAVATRPTLVAPATNPNLTKAIASPRKAPAAAPAKTLSNNQLQAAVEQFLAGATKRTRITQQAFWDKRGAPTYARIRGGYRVETNVLNGKTTQRIRFDLDDSGRVTKATNLSTTTLKK